MLRYLWFSLLLFQLVDGKTPVKIDTSGWVGAEYQPSKSANQDWLFHYDLYKEDIVKEVAMVKKAMGFTAFRVFLHSMVYFANPSKLVSVMDNFLTITSKSDIKVGFVFFDDCWLSSGHCLGK